jgi:endoglucanase
MKTSIPFPLFTAAAILWLGQAAALKADDIVPNGDFQKGAEGADWPENWGKPKAGGTWGKEDSNRFLSLKSETPGAMVMLYQEFKIPEGTEAVELSWKQRVTGLKKGTSPWFDARIMLEFSNVDRAKMPGSPKAPNVGKDTNGWEEKKVSFLVPKYAVYLKFMPALFQVEAGTFDIDDVVVKKIDPASIPAAPAKN